MKNKGPIFLMIISGLLVVTGTIFRIKHYAYGDVLYYAGLLGVGLALAMVFGKRR